MCEEGGTVLRPGGLEETEITLWYWTAWDAPAVHWCELTDPPSPAPHWNSAVLRPPHSESPAKGVARWTKATINAVPAIEFVVRSGPRFAPTQPRPPTTAPLTHDDDPTASSADAAASGGGNGADGGSAEAEMLAEAWDNPPHWRGGNNYVARSLTGQASSWALKDGHLMLLLPSSEHLERAAVAAHPVESDYGGKAGERGGGYSGSDSNELHPDTAAVAICLPSHTQHGGAVEEAARTHGLHNATCGFCALAVATVVAREANPSMTWGEVEGVLAACRDPSKVLPLVHAVMHHAKHRRGEYLKSHGGEFRDDEAGFYSDAMLQECEASWWLRDNRYGCSTEATPPVADPAAVHLIRQVQIRDFDPDLYLGGGSEAEFARHEAEKRWVAEEAGLRATGEPWFVEAPHYDKSGTFCSGQGEVTAGDGSRIHASWAKEHAAIWRYRGATPMSTVTESGRAVGTMSLVANVSNHFVAFLPVWLEPSTADDTAGPSEDTAGFVLPIPVGGRPVLLCLDSGGATTVSARQGHALCAWLMQQLLGPAATAAAASLDPRCPSGEVVAMERLGLESHQLSEVLPKGGCEGVRCLALNHNRLSTFPVDVLTPFVGLTLLHLNDNLMTELPDEIASMQTLKDIRLDRNRLRRLPDALGELKALEVLHVAENLLSTLPKVLGQAHMPQLREVFFLGNPLTGGLPETLQHIDPSIGVWQAN